MRDEDAAVEMVPRTNRRRSDDTRRTQEQTRRNEQELQQLRNRVRDQRIQIAQNTADNKQQVNYITQLEVENQNSRARYEQQTKKMGEELSQLREERSELREECDELGACVERGSESVLCAASCSIGSIEFLGVGVLPCSALLAL